MLEQQKPLTLVHGYGFDEPSRNKPDFRGRLTILAAQELQRRGIIGRFVITGGKQQVNEPELAEPMQKQFHRNNPNLSAENIIVSPVPGGTIGELRKFKKIAKNVGSNKLAVIATETHLGRIRRRLQKLYGDKAENVQVFSVEDVLTNTVTSRRYVNLVDTLRNSEDEEVFREQEKTIEKIEKFPFGTLFVDYSSRIPFRFTIKDFLAKTLRRS